MNGVLYFRVTGPEERSGRRDVTSKRDEWVLDTPFTLIVEIGRCVEISRRVSYYPGLG